MIHGYKEEDKRSIKDGGFFFSIFENSGERSRRGLMNTISVNYITCNLHFGEQRSYSIEVPTGYIVSARTRETAKNEFKKKLNSEEGNCQ